MLKTRYVGLIISLLIVLQVLIYLKPAYAEYPGQCIFEQATFKWHYEVYPTMPKHYFPTEENPMTFLICDLTRSIDSSGQYNPSSAACAYRTVTSGEYWGMTSSAPRYIKLYYFENTSWILSDTFPINTSITVIYFSNEEKIYLDSLRTSLPPGCPDPQSCTDPDNDGTCEENKKQNIGPEACP